MTIGIDAGCLGIQDARLEVGVYQMAKNLFRELAKLDKKNTYLLYSFYPIDKMLLKFFGKKVKNVVVTPVRGWNKIWIPLRLLKDKPDVFVGLNQALPLKLPTQTYKSIVIIHDLLFEVNPKLYPGSYRKLHKESRLAAENADIIIVPSFATKKDLENYYKISEDKITVIPEGVRAFPGETQNSKLKTQNSNYFLFVGALKPQKNVPMLLRAFQILSNQPPMINNNIQLIIVGGDKWKDKEIDKAFAKLPINIQKRINFLGNVGENELASLYRNAIAFVSPSLSEGFGLTFLEAMSFGVPVIGPDRGAVPEVVKQAGMLIDPTDENALVRAMEQMLDTKVKANFRNKALIQSKKFSWEKFAGKFLQTIETYS